jgi:hypothetical protein
MNEIPLGTESTPYEVPLRLSLPQSTYIYRAPQCMSPRWNWDSPTPLAASECALPLGPKGGGAHSPAAKGVGESQFQRLEKRLALCLLCGVYPERDTVLSQRRTLFPLD